MSGKSSFQKKTSAEYKAKLEKKLCIARENPEPVFDLSDCGIKQVPNNIFSLCKVFRKYALFLQNNELSDFQQGGSLQDLKNLKILNVSSNKFTALPSNIKFLECLEVLDVSSNQIVNLPIEIEHLQKLKYLNVSSNNLKSLPDSLGNCHNLEELYVHFNAKLKKIPVSLGHLCKLRILKLDASIIDLSKELFFNEMKNFLNCFDQELENNATNASATITFKNMELIKENTFSKSLQDKETNYKIKEQNLININLTNLDNKLQDAKNKLLNDIKSEQEELNRKLCKLQEQKNANHASLIQIFQKEEQESCDAVSRILESNQKMRINCFNDYLKERKQEEKLMNDLLLTSCNKPVERHQVLVSMDKTMREEVKRFQAYNDEKRIGMIRSLATRITSESAIFKELIAKSKETKKQLLDSIQASEELQKSAFAFLLEKSDIISWEFSKQIAMIEKKLAEMTKLELFKKQIEADYHLAEVNKNRNDLMEVLMKLFEKQKERREELLTKMRKLEEARKTNKSENNFWFQQYHLLLNSKSNEMVEYLESLDSKLVYELFAQGVFHYLPLLKDFALNNEKLENLDSDILNKIGIKNPKDRENVLKAVQNFLAEEKLNAKIPSATSDVEPSAPPATNFDLSLNSSFAFLVPEECVICLDLQPNMVFIPCGHVCSCYKCSLLVATCPICRKHIDEKYETFL